MCGYRFVFCASSSGCDNGGPGYCRGRVRVNLEGWDGGLNLAGFSRTLGLDVVDEDANLPTCCDRDTPNLDREEEVIRIFRRISPRGKRKRGIVAVILVIDE